MYVKAGKLPLTLSKGQFINHFLLRRSTIVFLNNDEKNEGHLVQTQGSESHFWKQYGWCKWTLKVLELPTKTEKVVKGRQIDMICV